jgi:hypothetical protein
VTARLVYSYYFRDHPISNHKTAKMSSKKEESTSTTMTSESSTKKPKLGEGDVDLKYQIIEGSSKYSDEAKLFFLSPEHRTTQIYSALQQSKEKHFEWSVLQDLVSKTVVSVLPKPLAYVIDDTVLSDAELPNGEDEILDILMGSVKFLKKYVTLEVINGKDGWEESNLVGIVIAKPEHLVIYDRLQELASKSESDGDARYAGGVDMLSRSQFKAGFGQSWPGYTTVHEEDKVTDEWVEDFMERTEDMEYNDEIEGYLYGLC